MNMQQIYRDGKFEKPATYAVKHKELQTRMASRSGGIFTALSDVILGEGGSVYGCMLTEDMTAKHIRAGSADQRNKMRGSKYVQSEMGTVFQAVRQDLSEGKKVLFTGTSCQVAGLHGYLGKDYENLFCMDIVCHGVPSPLVWKDYLKWQEQKNKAKVTGVDFRNKRDYGWRAHIESLFFQNGRQVDSKVFTRLFYSHNILRPCCYRCPYKDVIHPGDITAADYWGIDKAAPGFNDDKGVSLVLINDEKGMNLFNKSLKELEIRETSLENSMQAPLKAPFDKPVTREKFWRNYSSRSFDSIAAEYGNGSAIKGFLRKIRAKYKMIKFKILRKY